MWLRAVAPPDEAGVEEEEEEKEACPVSSSTGFRQHGFVTQHLELDVASFVRLLLLLCERRFLDNLDLEVWRRHPTAFTFPEAMSRLFDAKKRKAYFGEEDAKRIRYTLNGNCKMALGNMSNAWTKSGFGMWAQLRSLAITYKHILPAAATLITAVTGKEQVLANLSHPIYRPPSGPKLAFHTDGIALRTAYMIAARNNDTIEAWVRKFGSQTLVHLHGAVTCGQTLALSGMDPNRYFLILCMLHPTNLHPDIIKFNADKAWAPNDGPIFVAYDNKSWLAVFNRVLEHFETGKPLKAVNDGAWIAGLNAEDTAVLARKFAVKLAAFKRMIVVPMMPAGQESSGYICSWPTGFPHGAARNIEPRLSFTIPLQPAGSVPVEHKTRCQAWLRAVSNRDWEYLVINNEVFAGGATHKSPQKEADLYEYFGSLFVTPADMHEINARFFNN